MFIYNKTLVTILIIIANVFLLGSSYQNTETISQRKLLKIMHINEDEYIKTMATNGKDIVMLAALGGGYLLVYDGYGEFQYMLQFPGGGTIQHIYFIDDITVKMIYGKGNTPYIFNLFDLNLQLVDSGKSAKRDFPYSVKKIQLDNGNIFKLQEASLLQSEVKMYYDQGKSKTIYKQNLKNTIIVITIISLMLATLLYKKHKKQKNSK